MAPVRTHGVDVGLLSSSWPSKWVNTIFPFWPGNVACAGVADTRSAQAAHSKALVSISTSCSSTAQCGRSALGTAYPECDRDPAGTSSLVAMREPSSAARGRRSAQIRRIRIESRRGPPQSRHGRRPGGAVLVSRRKNERADVACQPVAPWRHGERPNGYGAGRDRALWQRSRRLRLTWRRTSPCQCKARRARSSRTPCRCRGP